MHRLHLRPHLTKPRPTININTGQTAFIPQPPPHRSLQNHLPPPDTLLRLHPPVRPRLPSEMRTLRASTRLSSPGRRRSHRQMTSITSRRDQIRRPGHPTPMCRSILPGSDRLRQPPRTPSPCSRLIRKQPISRARLAPMLRSIHPRSNQLQKFPHTPTPCICLIRIQPISRSRRRNETRWTCLTRRRKQERRPSNPTLMAANRRSAMWTSSSPSPRVFITWILIN